MGNVMINRSASRLFILEFLHKKVADDVQDYLVSILRLAHVMGRDIEMDIATTGKKATVPSSDTDDFATVPLYSTGSVGDIGGVAATTDGNKEITGLEEAVDLEGEAIVEVGVVGIGGDGSNVRQGTGPDSSQLEIGGHVAGKGCRPTIADEPHRPLTVPDGQDGTVHVMDGDGINGPF